MMLYHDDLTLLSLALWSGLYYWVGLSLVG